jgi:hypothetical protein
VRYQFLLDTYETEILKVVSVWGMFNDADIRTRPHVADPRGRNLLEHMIHQCMSEDIWFKTMFGIAVMENPLPAIESRAAFQEAYSMAAGLRLGALRGKPEGWWEEETAFFEVTRPRLWIMTRRLNHTAHHRGQQTALLRMFGKSLHSTYGPTADTGGLPVNRAPTVYAPAPLPGPGSKPCTERP